MIRVGMLGGMSYQSTLHYYEMINKLVNEAFGDNVTADLVITSDNFQIIEDLMNNNDWDTLSGYLIDKAQGLSYMGADVLVIATNTIHKLADKISHNTGLPIIHIADAIANKIMASSVRNAGLLGTKTTMTEDFISSRIKSRGILVNVPNEGKDIAKINRIIFEELCVGKTTDNSKEFLLKTIHKMEHEDHIEGVILGCTELDMIIKQSDTHLPLFDSTTAHIEEISNTIIKSHTKVLKR